MLFQTLSQHSEDSHESFDAAADHDPERHLPSEEREEENIAGASDDDGQCHRRKLNIVKQKRSRFSFLCLCLSLFCFSRMVDTRACGIHVVTGSRKSFEAH